MKRIPQSLEENFLPVVLYRDEVEEIVRILRSVSESVEMSAATCSFESDTEWLDSKSESIPAFRIQSRNPDITLSLSPQKVSLALSDDLPQGRGAFEQVKQAIRRSVRKPEFLYSDGGLLLTVFGGGFACLYWEFHAGWFIILGYCFWHNHIEKHRHGIVIPKYRRDAPTFWNRNSDKIILAAISAVVGSVITLFVNRVVMKPTKATSQSITQSNSATNVSTNSAAANSENRK